MVGRSQILRGFGFSMMSRLAIFGLKFVTVPLLARLLSPAELGEAAAAMTVVLLLVQVGGAGLNAALIIQKEEDPRTLDSVFWSNLAVAAVCALMLLFFADNLAVLLGAPGAGPLLRALSLLFPISLAAQVGLALLARRMQFSRDMLCNLCAELAGAGVAISLAFLGFGVWAIIAQQFASATLLLVAVFFASGYRPRLQFSWPRLAALMRFGIGNLGADIANFATFQGPLVVVSRALGVAEAGAYSMASRLSDIPNQVILVALTNVLFPAFSSVSDEPARHRSLLLNSVQTTTMVLAPLMFGLWALAEPVTTIILGGRWIATAPVFGMLAVSKGVMSPCGSFIPFMKGMGRGGTLWWFAVFRAALTLLATSLGARYWGLYAATELLVVVNFAIMMIYAVTVFRSGGVDLVAGLRCAGIPMLTAAAAALAMRAFLVGAAPWLGSGIAMLVAAIAVGILAYACLCLIFQHSFCMQHIRSLPALVRRR